jgi:hypothetical protein
VIVFTRKPSRYKRGQSAEAAAVYLILLIAATAAFTVWTIAATNLVWNAEDVGSANYMVRFCRLKPVEAFTNPNAAYLHGRCIGTLETVMLMTDVLPR